MNARKLALAPLLIVGAAFALVCYRPPRATGTAFTSGSPNVTNAAGTLPLANLTQGTADQLLGENHGATAPAYFTLAGDGTIASGSLTNTNLSGSAGTATVTAATALNLTPPSVSWLSSVAAPTISQASTGSATQGANLTITPQQSTQATNQGGGSPIFSLQTPTGTGAEAFLTIKRGGTIEAQLGLVVGSPTYGALYLGNITPASGNYALANNGTLTIIGAATGGTDNMSVGGTIGLAVSGTTVTLEPGGTTAETLTASAVTLSQPTTASSSLTSTGTLTASAGFTENVAPVLNSPQTIACGTGGTQTVAASATAGLIVTSGTLSSNCTIDFSTNATSGHFDLDMTGVTLGATFGVIFKNGTSSSTTYITTNTIVGSRPLATIWTHGANTLAVNF